MGRLRCVRDGGVVLLVVVSIGCARSGLDVPRGTTHSAGSGGGSGQSTGASGGASSSHTAASTGSAGWTACRMVPLACPPTMDGYAPPAETCEGAPWAEWPMPDPEPARIPTSNYAIDAADGVVTDTVTNLMWQEPTPNNTFTWAEARCYCASLTLAGHHDWHLPTRIELVSLIDETIPSPGPSINKAAFPSTVAGSRGPDEAGYGYWTSTPKAGDASQAWKVHFDFLYGNDTAEDLTSGERVRCVRSPEQSQVAVPPAHWKIQEGTVYDNFTQLTWQQSVPVTGGDDGYGNYTWSNAKSHCAQLTLGGGGWRLPRVKELATIVDDAAESPAIDSSVFPGTAGPPGGAAISDSFWTSTLVTGFSTAGLLVDFGNGNVFDDGVEYTYRVRCVR